MAAAASGNQVSRYIFIAKRFVVQVMHRQVLGTVTDCAHVVIKLYALLAFLLPRGRCNVLFIGHVRNLPLHLCSNRPTGFERFLFDGCQQGHDGTPQGFALVIGNYGAYSI